MKLREFHKDYWWPLVSGKVRECTLVGYASIWRNHIEEPLGDMELGDISPRIIDAWLDSFKTPGVARRSFAVLRTMLRTAYKYELLEKDPTPKVLKLPPKRVVPQPTLTKGEVEQLIAGFEGHELEAWVTLMVVLGLRREEGCALLWDDIDLDKGSVRITKGAQFINGRTVINPPKSPKGDRTVFIPRSRIARIRSLAGDGCVTPYNPSHTAQAYKKHCVHNKLPYVPPKNLRTTFATLAVADGWDVARIATWMGHSDPAVTMTNYMHPRTEDLMELTGVWEPKEAVPAPAVEPEPDREPWYRRLFSM